MPEPDPVEDARALLRRNHPDLTDDEIEAILTGPPARRRQPPRQFDNYGKRAAPYEAASAGRTTKARRDSSTRGEEL